MTQGLTLTYLSMVRRMPMDAADWVLSRNFNSLFNPRVAPALGVDLDLFNALDQRQQQLGYRHGRALLTWAVARLLLWRGDSDITSIDYDDLTAFGTELCAHRIYASRSTADEWLLVGAGSASFSYAAVRAT